MLVTLYFKVLLILAEPWRQPRANHPAAPYLPLPVATQVPLALPSHPGQAPSTCAVSFVHCLRLCEQTREYIRQHVEVGDQPQNHGSQAVAGRTFRADSHLPDCSRLSFLPATRGCFRFRVLGGPAPRIPSTAPSRPAPGCISPRPGKRPLPAAGTVTGP